MTNISIATTIAISPTATTMTSASANVTMPTQPVVNLAAIAARARIYQQIREFFALRQVMEVETALLWPTADQTTQSMVATTITANVANDQLADHPQNAFLHTAAHPAMQHLLAQGSGAIYQIAKAFRAIEPDRKHQREFALLTWYRPDFNALQMMQEISDLLSILFAAPVEPKILSYKQAFLHRLDINPLSANIKTLKDSARRVGLNVDLGQDRAAWLRLLFSQMIEPTLGMDYPVYLTDFPHIDDAQSHDSNTSFSTLRSAKTNVKQDDDGNQVLAGFDLYIDGLKLASAHEQVIHGLDCVRVTLGLDHLLMVLLNTRRIDKVQALAGGGI